MAVQPVVQPQGQQTVVVVQQVGDPSVDASADSCSVIMFVLGFFFPLLCLINGCMHACHKSKKAACFGKVSLILGLIEIIAVVVVIVIMISAVATVATTITASSYGGLGGETTRCATMSDQKEKCDADANCMHMTMMGMGMCSSMGGN